MCGFRYVDPLMRVVGEELERSEVGLKELFKALGLSQKSEEACSVGWKSVPAAKMLKPFAKPCPPFE